MRWELTVRCPYNIFEAISGLARIRGDSINTQHSRRLKHDVYHLIVVYFSSVFCLLMTNLDCLRPPSSASSVSHELSLNTPIHSPKQERCTVDSLGYSQVAMILQNHAFGIS